ncbi:MAG: SLC13 family permease, partial [Sedimentisphaerales bacterium]|nr:SLC13 family permease [Sedimentisphaerales bacterium]
GLINNRAPDALLLGALVLVSIAGIISPEEALAGFSNAGMLTVGALYVVAAALRETGTLDVAGSWILGNAKSERGALVRMAGSVTAMSAFLNNTPIVAMFIPIVTGWCKKHRIAPSRLLLPLSYLSIIGGTCTLIGTSTNLVVNGLMEETSRSNPELSQALHPMGFFELGYVGLPCAIVGIIYLLVIGRRLLPNRKDLIEKFTESSREYLVNMRVQPNCRLVGQMVQEAGLRRLPGLFLVEVTRDDLSISPVLPDFVLKSNDILTFTGVVSTIVDLEKIQGLVPVADEGYETHAAKRRERILCEVVVSKTCPSIGKSIRDADFRALYNAAVVAVHRGGTQLTGKVGDIVLRAGDTLLLQAGAHFIRAHRNNSHFLLVGGIDNSRPLRHEKAVWSLVLLVVLIILMVSGVIKIVLAAFLVAGLMILMRCISVSDARQSIDWQTLLTIAAAFGLSKALVNSGFVASVAGFFVNIAGQWGPYGVLACVYLMTSLFTEAVTNNAAAALIFPFAVALAGQAGVNPRPFIMAVTFAASASFMTPLGYQTNLMVFGPGGYRFTDFVRVGLPLNLLLLICATILIPLVWHF